MAENKTVTTDNTKPVDQNIATKTTIKLEDVLNKEGISSFEDITAILSLPDKEFTALSEIILIELENAISDSNNLILLQEEMKTYGLTQDELVEKYGDLMMTLDKIEGIGKDRIDFLKRYIGLITNAFTEGQRASKRIIEIPIETADGAEQPRYAHVGDAGIDIKATEDIEIKPGETKLIKTGIKMAIPKGFEIQVRPRSGLSLKTKMRVANAPGTIDSNYRGEIGIIIDNIEPPIKDITYEPVVDETGKIKELNVTSILHGESFFVNKGDRIAQLVLAEIPTAHFYPVDNIGIFASDRGENGFGSSGK